MAIKLFTVADLDIPTAGTRVQLSATATPVSAVIIQAKATNSGLIFVGDSSVSATRGISLAAGKALSLTCEEMAAEGEEFFLSDIYVDAATNGDDVKISYVKRR